MAIAVEDSDTQFSSSDVSSLTFDVGTVPSGQSLLLAMHKETTDGTGFDHGSEGFSESSPDEFVHVGDPDYQDWVLGTMKQPTGGSEPSTYEIGHDDSDAMVGCMIRLSGAEGIDDADEIVGIDLEWPSITPSVGNCRIFRIGYHNGTDVADSLPSGTVICNVHVSSGDVGLVIIDQGNQGDTPSATGTDSAGVPGFFRGGTGWTIAVAPAAAGGDPEARLVGGKLLRGGLLGSGSLVG